MATLDDMSVEEMDQLAMDLAVGDFAEGPGKAVSEMSNEELLAEYKRVEELTKDTSMIDKFMYGWDRTDVEFEVNQKYEQQRPGTLAQFAGPPGAMTAFDAADISVGTDKALESQADPEGFAADVRKKQVQDKVEFLKKTYPNLVNEPDTWATIAGDFAAYLSGPSTTLPFPSKVPQAIAMGAGLGAYDVASRQMVEKGEIDPVAVGLATAIGGGAAGITQGLINLFTKKVAAKDPVKTTDLDKFIKEGDNRILADQINERLGITPHKETRKRTLKSGRDIEAAFNEKPGTKFGEMDQWTADELENLALNSTKKQAVTDAEKQLDVLVKREEAFRKVEQQKQQQMDELWRIHENKKAPVNQPKSVEAETTDLTKVLDQSSKKISNKFYNQGVPKGTSQLEEGLFPLKRERIREEIFGGAKASAPKVPSKAIEADVEAAFAEKELEKLVQRENDFSKAEMDKMREIDQAWESANFSKKYPTALEEAYHKAKLNKLNYSENLSKDVSDGLSIARKQAGAMSPQVMQHIASTGIGASVGYAIDPTPEGAMMGAIIGGATPWTVGKLYKALKSETQHTKSRIAERLPELVRPWTAVENMGPSGELLSKYMDLTNLNIDLRIGEAIHKVEDRMFRLSKEEQANLIKTMQKAEKPLSPEIRQLSTDLRNIFEQNVREYSKIGIISPQKAMELIKTGRTKGYWPRIYNEAFLDTSQGKKAWEDFFESQKWTKDSVEKTFSKILHGDPERVKFYMKSVKKDGETYFIPRHIARNLLKERKNLRVSNKSSHIEESRSINVEEEQMLNQFMIDDPYAVLNDYLHNTYKRLEYAKTFGVKDENAHRLFKKIENDLTKSGMSLTEVGNANRFAQNMYWTSIGSSHSETIANQMKLGEAWKWAYGKADAVSTWLLTHAQILNMGQALANGTVQIAGTKNPISAFLLAWKGILRSAGTDGKKLSQQVNAAGEATLMEIMGEYGSKHKVWNRQLPAAVEWMNDPTKFLQVTGFSFVEKLQRRFAVNMGKAYVEDLIERKGRLLARQQAGKWFSERKLNNINKALDELYIDPKATNLEMIPERDMLRAALKFSDLVNFRSNPRVTPLAMQAPHARLFKKFKTFVYQQGAFVNEKMRKPAVEYIKSGGKQGTISPVLAFFGPIVMTVGTPIDALRDFISGDDRELTGLERYFNAIFAVGGLGIFADLAKSAFYGEGKVTSALAGPTISQAEKVTQGIINTGRKIAKEGEINLESANPFFRGVTKSLVFPGRDILADALKEKSQSSRGTRRRRSGNSRRKRD